MCRHPSSSKCCLLVIVGGGVFPMSPPHPRRSRDPCLTNSEYFRVVPMQTSGLSLGICFPHWSEMDTCLVLIVLASHLYLNHTCAQALSPRLKLYCTRKEEASRHDALYECWKQGKEHGCGEIKCNWLTWKSNATLKK